MRQTVGVARCGTQKKMHGIFVGYYPLLFDCVHPPLLFCCPRNSNGRLVQGIFTVVAGATAGFKTVQIVIAFFCRSIRRVGCVPRVEVQQKNKRRQAHAASQADDNTPIHRVRAGGDWTSSVPELFLRHFDVGSRYVGGRQCEQ